IDTDCHHGDGTQDIYWHDPNTLFVSVHQDGRTLYPGSGFINEFGGPNAAGSTLNIPLPPNTSDEGYLYTVENAILPILDEFKPDIIINSAGQDNHFSDPLTNMNFSAKGYADLTSLLKPDIAVLEGGYSIEGALPYVNMGIILAMAGLDYSNIKEPNYDPSRLSQSSSVSGSIKDICKDVLNVWNSRDALRDKIRGDGKFHERARNIMYDTDNIYEMQKEKIMICDDCAGSIRIESSSDTGHNLFGVHIPVDACKKCKEVGYDWFETGKAGSFKNTLLQDRSEDNYVTS
ncbi:MAG: histone deacetylase, partial [Proteobacteria bacterium]|nr:histone deacetylase [Pseudomonadota bacterium]